MHGELQNYLNDDGSINVDQVPALRARLAEIIASDEEAYSKYEWFLEAANESSEKTISWNLGDYSSLQSDLNDIHDGE